MYLLTFIPSTHCYVYCKESGRLQAEQYADYQGNLAHVQTCTRLSFLLPRTRAWERGYLHTFHSLLCILDGGRLQATYSAKLALELTVVEPMAQFSVAVRVEMKTSCRKHGTGILAFLLCRYVTNLLSASPPSIFLPSSVSFPLFLPPFLLSCPPLSLPFLLSSLPPSLPLFLCETLHWIANIHIQTNEGWSSPRSTGQNVLQKHCTHHLAPDHREY